MSPQGASACVAMILERRECCWGGTRGLSGALGSLTGRSTETPGAKGLKEHRARHLPAWGDGESL